MNDLLRVSSTGQSHCAIDVRRHDLLTHFIARKLAHQPAGYAKVLTKYPRALFFEAGTK
jgi:hypothetical protein